MTPRSIVLVLIGLLISSCGGQREMTAAMPTSVQPAQPPARFDGVYRGPINLVWKRPPAPTSPGYRSSTCDGRGPNFKLVVMGDKFVAGRFEGTVGADGKFFAMRTAVLTNTIEGVVDGAKAVGTLSNVVCAWRFETTKQSSSPE